MKGSGTKRLYISAQGSALGCYFAAAHTEKIIYKLYKKSQREPSAK